MSEQDWIEGNRAAWRRILGIAIGELMALGEGQELDAAKLLAEREDVRRALRSVCENHGDNDWSDNLHLGDVIEKHLERHLDRRTGK